MSDQGASYNAISEIMRLKEENQQLREDKTELLAELYSLAFDEGVLGKGGALPKWTATFTQPMKDGAMEIAKLMWDAYAIQAGGNTFDGKPLPTWDELGAERQSCWLAAASVTADRIEKLEAALRPFARAEYILTGFDGNAIFARLQYAKDATETIPLAALEEARKALEGK